MAVTAASLAVAIRLTTDDDDYPSLSAGQRAVVERVLGAATAEVVTYLGGAGAAALVDGDVVDEATIRVASYLYDADAPSARAQHPLRQSGAESLLARFRNVRLLTGADAPADSDAGDGGGLSVAQVQAIADARIAAHEADSDAHHAPPEAGVDQTARDGAQMAQAAADSALAAIAALGATFSTDAERTAAVAQLQAAIDAIDTTGMGGLDNSAIAVNVAVPDDNWIDTGWPLPAAGLIHVAGLLTNYDDDQFADGMFGCATVTADAPVVVAGTANVGGLRNGFTAVRLGQTAAGNLAIRRLSDTLGRVYVTHMS